MKSMKGYEMEHRVEVNDGLALVRFHGVPREQVTIEGSVSSEYEIRELVAALEEWAKDPVGFWAPAPREED